MQPTKFKSDCSEPCDFFDSHAFKGITILTLSGIMIGMCLSYWFNPVIATPHFLLFLGVLALTLFIFCCMAALDWWAES